MVEAEAAEAAERVGGVVVAAAKAAAAAGAVVVMVKAEVRKAVVVVAAAVVAVAAALQTPLPVLEAPRTLGQGLLVRQPPPPPPLPQWSLAEEKSAATRVTGAKVVTKVVIRLKN